MDIKVASWSPARVTNRFGKARKIACDGYCNYMWQDQCPSSSGKKTLVSTASTNGYQVPGWGGEKTTRNRENLSGAKQTSSPLSSLVHKKIDRDFIYTHTHTHTHTCKWKFRNFSCELVRVKARFPARLISRFRSFRTQFLVSSGRVRFPATTRLADAGRGLLCILILFIESISSYFTQLKTSLLLPTLSLLKFLLNRLYLLRFLLLLLLSSSFLFLSPISTTITTTTTTNTPTCNPTTTTPHRQLLLLSLPTPTTPTTTTIVCKT